MSKIWRKWGKVEFRPRVLNQSVLVLLGRFKENCSGEMARGMNLRAGRAHFAGVPKLKFRVVARAVLAPLDFGDFLCFLAQFG